MNRGYVKIYRCIEDNILWRSDEPFCKRAAWEDLILLVNHDDNNFMIGNQKIVVKRGQHWTSDDKLALRWHWSIKKVRAFLEFLQNENMIYIERTNRGSCLTLVNYGKYQDFKTIREEPKTEQKIEQKKFKGKAKDKTEDRAKDRLTIMTNNELSNEVKNDSKNIKKPAAQRDFFEDYDYMKNEPRTKGVKYEE